MEKRSAFSSLVFIQGDDRLRLDILQPFVGLVASLIINKEEVFLLSPIKKQYYKGALNSELFFPQFPSVPGRHLITLLRAKTPEEWACRKQNGLLDYCQIKNLEIRYKYQRSDLTGFFLKDSTGRQIQAEIQNISIHKPSPRLFQPVLKNWKREKNPGFF